MVAQGEDALHPPFDPDLLADLHAGALPPEFADRLRVASAQDPEARRVLAALDSVRGQLGALRASDAPPPPAPPEVIARIEAALAAEGAVAATPASVSALDGRTARRRRPVRLLAAAAAVAVVAGGAVFALTRPDDATGPATPAVALDSPTPSATSVDLGSDLQPAVALGLLGRTDLGPLSAPGARDGCLRANGVDPTTPLLGSGPVRLRGVPGLLMLFPGAQLPQITALVVGAGCTDSDPATLARADIG